MSEENEDVDMEALWSQVRSKMPKEDFDKLNSIRNQDKSEYWLNEFVTKSSRMLALKDSVRKLSNIELEDSVLIRGETGTGKELIAKALHGNKSGKFQAINCAGMPEHLIESELFGHKKGSFTGADRENEGLLISANDGTMFLDEVGDLNLGLQAKLLRAIQERTIRKVGDTKDTKITCRFIAATHRNLEAMMERGEFREDLYYRISTFELYTIPLRERKEDIEPIVSKLLTKKDIDKEDLRVFIASVKGKELKGNVRELARYIRRFEILGDYE